MGRLFVVLSLFCCICFSFIYQAKVDKQTKSEMILWNSATKLKWEDFKGISDQKSEYKAMTYVVVKYDFDIQNDLINIGVKCFFVKDLAWTKEKSVSLLKHEQLHFDIAELITRKIRKDLSVHLSKNIKETQTYIDAIDKKYYNQQLDSINTKYDTETNHSIIVEKQKEWELKIAKDLKALDKYASTKVVIKREKKK